MELMNYRLKIVFKTLRFCCKTLLFSCLLFSILFPFNTYADEPPGSDFDIFTEEMESKNRIAEPVPFDLGGFIQAYGALDTENDKANEHTRMTRDIIRLEGKWISGRNSINPAESNRLDKSNFYALASVEWDYLWFGPDHSTEDCDIRLFEGYFYWSRNPVDLSVGRQIVRWGKTDQISPVDNLNSQDLREFIIPDYEDRKIPNWMVRGRLFSDFLTLEGVYLPFFEPSRIDYFGTDWAIFQHLNQRSVHEEEPARNLKNGEGGVRLTKSVAGWDLGLSYLYAWEDMPFFETFPAGGGDARITYKRTNIAGFEFETTWKKIGLRGEAAWFDSQSFLTENFTSVTK
ncbi:MAG: hypothetical protein JRE23_17510, partial [Deltaproteobacteria bacterium]|nr:hypothetical protein [Deltaproteobacteria bacterium]MBW2647931.1 hypothetical protein [Deltaproteobacteria bacterium]